MSQILKNLQAARRVLAAAPEEQINLDFFATDSACGTLYCAAGWLATSPEFRDIMEIRWIPDMNGIISAHLCQPGQPDPKVRLPLQYTLRERPFTWLDEHFGERAFERLFAAFMDGELDPLHPLAGHEDEELLSHRDLAIWRFDREIGRLSREV